MAENVERDSRKEQELTALGWRVLVVWQCETDTRQLDLLTAKLEAALNAGHPERASGHTGSDIV